VYTCMCVFVLMCVYVCVCVRFLCSDAPDGTLPLSTAPVPEVRFYLLWSHKWLQFVHLPVFKNHKYGLQWSRGWMIDATGYAHECSCT